MMFDNKPQHTRLFNSHSTYTQLTFNQMERDLDAETGTNRSSRKEERRTPAEMCTPILCDFVKSFACETCAMMMMKSSSFSSTRISAFVIVVIIIIYRVFFSLLQT